MRRHNPGLNPAQRTAASILVDALKESVAETDEAKALWDERRATRDKLIREALSLIPKVRMAQITGLSRDRLYQIEHSPETRKD